VRRSIRKHLTYANVTSSLALFVALGGATALASGALSANSVGTRQIRNRAVTTAKIARGAVTTNRLGTHAVGSSQLAPGSVNGATVRDHSLTAGDFAPNQLLDPRLDDLLGHFSDPHNPAAAGAGVDCYLGQITLTAAANALPSGYRPANGALVQITGNEGLYQVIGTNYGGDGVNNYALPDLTAIAPTNMTYGICDKGTYPASR
jgi:hypothetical protein